MRPAIHRVRYISGRHDVCKDIKNEFLKERLEPKAPTLFEYLRKTFDVPGHQALIINGKNRASEDCLTSRTFQLRSSGESANRHYPNRHYIDRITGKEPFAATVSNRGNPGNPHVPLMVRIR